MVPAMGDAVRTRLALVTMLLASLVAIGATPIRLESSIALSTTALLAFSCTAATASGMVPLWYGACGLVLLLGASAVGIDPELSCLAFGLFLLVAGQRGKHGQTVLSLRGAAMTVMVLLSGRLQHAFDPGLFDLPSRALIEGLAAVVPVDVNCDPLIGGALLLIPVVLAVGALRLTTRAAVLALGSFLAACLAGTILESSWPAVLVATAVPLFAQATDVVPPSFARVRSGLAIAASTVLTVYLVAVYLTVDPSPNPPRVGFVGAMKGSFDHEPREAVRRRNFPGGPYFGNFWTSLSEQADLIKLTDAEDESLISSCDVLVTINLSGKDVASWVEPLRRAVRGGARLLVLADHTDLFGQMKPTNALLEGSGIKLAFDSAVPSSRRDGWDDCMLTGSDPLFGGFRYGRGLAWSVGCSLTLDRAARCLALASRAFIDEGVRAKVGGLGNLVRDTGERLGGFPIAASGKIGNGSTLVFGDTSCLQDGALARNPDFFARLVDWMHGEESANGLASSRIAAVLVLALSIALAWLVLDKWHWGLVYSAAFLTMLLASWGPERRTNVQTQRPIAFVPLEYVPDQQFEDLRHGPWLLLHEATQNGFSVRWALAGENPHPDRDVVILVDPKRSLASEETKRLTEFCDAGGRLLAFVGPDGVRALSGFFKKLEATVGMPVGTGSFGSKWVGGESPKLRPSFSGAFQLSFANSENVTVRATVLDRPVAIDWRIGRGKCIVVGDPQLPTAATCHVRYGGNLATYSTFLRFFELALSG